MAEGMNKVYLIGNLGADAELNHHGGNALLKFNLATTERWKDKEGSKQERTEWHRCSLWGTRADKLAPYLTKGTTLLVEGGIRNDSYEKDGQKHHTTEIRVRDVKFISGKRPDDRPGVDLADVVSGRAAPPPFPNQAHA